MPKRNVRKSSSRKHGRRSTRRNPVRRGGGQGSGWTPGGPVVPGIQNDAQVHVPYDACLSAPRPGQIAVSLTGGLPGMRGGAPVRGGAYTNNLVGDIAGFPQIDRLPCTPNYVNPQNQVGSHQSFVYPQVEGITQKGGVGLQSAQDMGVYEAPTARYTHAPSQWTDSVGAPILLNQALDARQWSKACTATAGGAKKGRGRKNRSNRANRKTRRNRSNRRNRRNSH